ncbi:MAG: hypothetical protein JSR93_03565 [Verrucomicrobia bacterium]|nr:hypothetical protein [Verrucomicrobiota bacterium]
MSIQPAQVQGSNASSFAAVMFEDLIPLENQINENSTRISIKSLTIGTDYNKAQCEDIIEKGEKQALGNWAQMGASIGSATMDGISLGATAYANSDLNAQYDKANTELDNLKKQQGYAQERLKQPPDLELSEDQKNARTKVLEDENVKGRIKEMKGGNFNNSAIKVEADQYSRSLDETSINAAGDDEVATIKQQLDQQVSDKTQTLNKLQNQISQNDTKFRTGFDMAKQGLVNAPSQAVQAVSAKETAQKESEAQGAQYGGTVQSSVQQAEQQLGSKAQDAIISGFQALVQAGQAVQG